MALVYIDDILCIHKDMPFVIDALESIYVMKQGSMGPPDGYLGANIEKVQTQHGKVVWGPTAEIIAWQKFQIWRRL